MDVPGALLGVMGAEGVSDAFLGFQERLSGVPGDFWGAS